MDPRSTVRLPDAGPQTMPDQPGPYPSPANQSAPSGAPNTRNQSSWPEHQPTHDWHDPQNGGYAGSPGMQPGPWQTGQPSPSRGTNRLLLVAIGLLLVALVGLVSYQFGGRSGADATAVADATTALQLVHPPQLSATAGSQVVLPIAIAGDPGGVTVQLLNAPVGVTTLPVRIDGGAGTL